MKFKGYYTIRCSVTAEDEEVYFETLDELNGLVYKIDYEKSELSLKFSIADDESQILQVEKNEKFCFPWCDNVLIIEADIDNRNQVEEDIIDKRIRDLFILISVCKNGIIDCPAGEYFIEQEHIYSCESFVHSINLISQSTKKYKWPKLKNLNFVSSICWWEVYTKQLDGVSENRIGRALNAYSHLFANSGGREDPATLFWAMVGIEAIYVEGNSSIQNQVNRKTQLFLGERNEFKKTFSQMYDYRSRFVHGDLNLTNKNFLETDYTLNHLYNFWEHQFFAISILVATFQNLILQNRHSLEFEYQMKDKA